MRTNILTIGVIALLFVAALFAGCASSTDADAVQSATQTATGTDSAVGSNGQTADLALVTQEDTDIGEMI